MTYCTYVQNFDRDNVHRKYHDTEYGFPLKEDSQLFERLVLEINQAGLSWSTILKKKENFSQAYDNFDIEIIADYGGDDVARLLKDAGIIRNRLKIQAAVYNARQIRELQRKHDSFKGWLDHHHPMPHADWVKLFRKQFKFTGGEIVREFLVSTGYLPGAHDEECAVYDKWVASQPPCLTG